MFCINEYYTLTRKFKQRNATALHKKIWKDRPLLVRPIDFIVLANNQVEVGKGGINYLVNLFHLTGER